MKRTHFLLVILAPLAFTSMGAPASAFAQGVKADDPELQATLEWASAQYTRGRQRNERVRITKSGDLALVVQYEHIWFHSPGQDRESERHYRVTTVLRREAGSWRVVHRHADTMMERETPR